jgi:hypothetical protein
MQPLALVKKWFTGALDSQTKGEKKEKSAMEERHRELHQSPLSPFLYFSLLL